MEFWRKVLAILDTSMTRPTDYGWFHLLFWALTIGTAVLLCVLYKKGVIKNVRRVVLITAITVIVLEIYKMINFGFDYESEKITYSFPWSSFPWQFCSTPMLIGLIAGLTRGKFHSFLCSFLATFAVFAGTAVMVYPGDVFIETIGINIQTMICHGSMITIGIFLYYTNYVEAKFKTILKAIPVFATCLGIAMILNEIGHRVGLTESHYFNLFYISPYEEGHLPVYSNIQKIVPYPWNLFIYILGFSAAACVILLIAMGIKAICRGIKNAKAKKTA